jgi:type-F conjugative transfer system pilin assembly protein TrbC
VRKELFIIIAVIMLAPLKGFGEDVHEFVNKLKSSGAVEEIQKDGEACAKNWENYEIDPKILEKAKETAKITDSPEFKKQVERSQKDILRSIEGYVPPATAKADTGSQEAISGMLLREDERVYIMVSSSMPDGTIRRYLGDISRIGDPNVTMVLRGIPGGVDQLKNFGNMLVDRWGAKDLDFMNIQIDPLIFQAYSIDAVPAIVYVSGLDLVDIEQSEGREGNATIKDACIIRGDVSLEYAVERIYQETGNSRVLDILQKMRRSFYGKQ